MEVRVSPLQDLLVFIILKAIMPTYEYECKSCSHNFEVFQSMSDPPVKDCPVCGKEVRRLIFGGTGVIFKGSGFYVTDKSKGSGKTETKPSSTQSAESAAKADPVQKQDSKGGEIPKERSASEPISPKQSSTESGSSEKTDLKSKSV